MSRYYSLAVMDMEAWSAQPAAVQAQMQRAFDAIVTAALRHCEIDSAEVGRTSRGDGAILSFPGDVPKERLTEQFVEALRHAIEESNVISPSAATIRLRLALHAGDAIDGGGQWAGRPVVLACRLVDSDLLRRVLAAARGQALAVILSNDWYEAVVREGHASSAGYEPVLVVEKDLAHEGWVRVPGRTRPPGLLPTDAVPTRQPQPEPARTPSARDGAFARNGKVVKKQKIDARGATFGGSLIAGDSKVVNNNYGPGARPSVPPLEPS